MKAHVAQLIEKAKKLAIQNHDLEGSNQPPPYSMRASPLQRQIATTAFDLRRINRSTLGPAESDELDTVLGRLVYLLAIEEDRKGLVWLEERTALAKGNLSSAKTKALRKPHKEKLRKICSFRTNFFDDILDPYRKDPQKRWRRKKKWYFRAIKKLGLDAHKSTCNNLNKQ